MKFMKRITPCLSAVTFAIVALGYAVSAGAEGMECGAGDLRTKEECACEAALKENTTEAFESFLEKYGDSVGTACTALARVSLDRLRPDSDPDVGPPTDGSPYAN